MLSRMLTDKPDSILPHIHRAEQALIWSSLTELRYLFRHALMRDAAYGMQLKRRLQNLHQAAAEAVVHLYQDDIENHAATLAYHYDQAEQWTEAGQWYRKAAKQAEAQYANHEAIRALSRSIDLTSEDELSERFELHKARSELYIITGDREALKEDIDHMLAIGRQLGNDNMLAKAYFRLASYYTRGNQTDEALAAIDKAVEANSRAQNVEMEIRIAIAWGQALWQSGQYEAAREKYLSVYAAAHKYDVALEAELLSSLSIICGISSDVQGAISYAEKALEIHRQVGNRFSEATTLNSLGIQARRLGNYSEAEAYYETSYNILKEFGFRFGMTVLSNNLALVWLEQGQYAQAMKLLWRSNDISKDLGAKRNGAWSLAHLSLVHLRLGNIENALQVAQQALALADESGDPDVRGYAYLYQGHALAGAGKWDEATAVYQQAVAIRQQLEQTNLSLEPMAGIVNLSLAQGTPEKAAVEAEIILEHLQKDPTLSGTNEPFSVHLTMIQYLQVRQDERQTAVSQHAYALLKERAEKISNPAMRDSFLQNVAAHREIIAANQT